MALIGQSTPDAMMVARGRTLHCQAALSTRRACRFGSSRLLWRGAHRWTSGSGHTNSGRCPRDWALARRGLRGARRTSHACRAPDARILGIGAGGLAIRVRQVRRGLGELESPRVGLSLRSRLGRTLKPLERARTITVREHGLSHGKRSCYVGRIVFFFGGVWAGSAEHPTSSQASVAEAGLLCKLRAMARVLLLAPMLVTINGAVREIPEGLTLRDLVVDLGLVDGPVAIEVNKAIVPRARHAEEMVRGGDVIEMVDFVGGG